MTRILSALAIVLFLAAPALAGPRDELLRVAPGDAALIVVVQNARDHFHNLAQSPFVEWWPSTTIGKKVLDSPALVQFRSSAAMIFRELDLSSSDLIDDVVGDAVAFAF